MQGRNARHHYGQECHWEGAVWCHQKGKSSRLSGPARDVTRPTSGHDGACQYPSIQYMDSSFLQLHYRGHSPSAAYHVYCSWAAMERMAPALFLSQTYAYASTTEPADSATRSGPIPSLVWSDLAPRARAEQSKPLIQATARMARMARMAIRTFAQRLTCDAWCAMAGPAGGDTVNAV